MFATKLSALIETVAVSRESAGWGLIALNERFWDLVSQNKAACARLRR